MKAKRVWSLGVEQITFIGLTFTMVALPTMYMVTPWLTVYRLMFIVALENALAAMAIARNRRIFIGPRTRMVILAALTLSLHLLIVDLARNNPGQGLRDFLAHMAILGLIPLAAFLPTHFWWRVRVVLLVSIVPMLFGIAQLVSPDYRIESIVGNNALFGFHTRAGLEDYIEITGRIVGTSNTAIGFSLMLGFVAIAGFVAWRRGLGKWAAAIAVLAAALTPWTLTRSAIVGLVPSAAIGFVLARGGIKRTVLTLTVAALIVAAIALYILPALGAIDPRVTMIHDSNTIVKVTTNLYGAEYVLRNDPLRGIPKDELYASLLETARVRGLPENVELSSLVTNHNQFGYVLRFYGLIGLAFLFWLIAATYRVIASTRDYWARALMLAVLIFSLQFSMLHNVFLYSLAEFWLLLAGLEEESERCQSRENQYLAERRLSTLPRRAPITEERQ